MAKLKACKFCGAIAETNETKCATCGSDAFTTFWQGITIILDAEKSEIAKKKNITKNGKYAMRLSV
jgi:RNA polymerase subunit RPABC4/transcription elongation factor Spt4